MADYIAGRGFVVDAASHEKGVTKPTILTNESDILKQADNVFLIPKHLLHCGSNRPISDNNVRRIRKNWSDAKCLTLEVRPLLAGDPRGVGYEVVIGNHRKLAADPLLQVTRLRCHIHYGMTDAEAAELWRSEAKDRKNPTAPDLFGNALLRKDPAALEVERLINSIGRVSALTKSSKATNVACLGTLMALHKKHPGTLERMFPLFGKLCEGEVAQEMVIRGLCAVESRLLFSASLAHKKWSDKLIRLGYAKLIKLMNDVTPHRGCHSERLWVEAIVHELNRRLQTEARLVARGINDEEPWALEKTSRMNEYVEQFMEG